MKKTLLMLFFAVICSGVFADSCDNGEISWVHCANEYGIDEPRDCSFHGTREVRIGNGEQWSTINVDTLLPSYKCTRSNFPTPPGGWGVGPFRCEYSDKQKYTVIAAPSDCDSRHDCKDIINTIPASETPHYSQRVKPSKATVSPDGIGAFRTICGTSHFAYDDPLVYPNQPSKSHLHMFGGNDSVNATSNPLDMANVGASTCAGGTLNRSAYWTPALIDTEAKAVMPASRSIWYYKEGYNGLAGTTFDPLPVGLGMIAREFYWECDDPASPAKYDHIPACGAGYDLQGSAIFPQCWDGINKWLPDESHTAYPSDGACPSTHPHNLPQITLNIYYTMQSEAQSAKLRLSSDHGDMPDGSTFHADWINGWDVDTSNTWLTNCLNASNDCHANLLGDGTILY